MEHRDHNPPIFKSLEGLKEPSNGNVNAVTRAEAMSVDLLGGSQLRASGVNSGAPSVINSAPEQANIISTISASNKVATIQPQDLSYQQRNGPVTASNVHASPQKVPMSSNLNQHLVQNRNNTIGRPTELPKVSQVIPVHQNFDQLQQQLTGLGASTLAKLYLLQQESMQQMGDGQTTQRATQPDIFSLLNINQPGASNTVNTLQSQMPVSESDSQKVAIALDKAKVATFKQNQANTTSLDSRLLNALVNHKTSQLSSAELPYDGIKAPAASNADKDSVEDFPEQPDRSEEQANQQVPSSSRHTTKSPTNEGSREVRIPSQVAQQTAQLTQKNLSSVALATLNDQKTDRHEGVGEEYVQNSHDMTGQEHMAIAGHLDAAQSTSSVRDKTNQIIRSDVASHGNVSTYQHMHNVQTLMQAYCQMTNQAAPAGQSPSLAQRAPNDLAKSISYLQHLKNLLNMTTQSTSANSGFVNGDSGKHLTGGVASSSTSGMQTFSEPQRLLLNGQPTHHRSQANNLMQQLAGADAINKSQQHGLQQRSQSQFLNAAGQYPKMQELQPTLLNNLLQEVIAQGGVDTPEASFKKVQGQSEAYRESIRLLHSLAQHSDHTNNQLNQALLENVRSLLGLPTGRTTHQGSDDNPYGTQPSIWTSGAAGNTTAATDQAAIDEHVKKLFKELQQQIIEVNNSVKQGELAKARIQQAVVPQTPHNLVETEWVLSYLKALHQRTIQSNKELEQLVAQSRGNKHVKTLILANKAQEANVQRILDIFGKLSKSLQGLTVSSGTPEDSNNTHNGPTDPSESGLVQNGSGSNERETVAADDVHINSASYQQPSALLQMLKNGRQPRKEQLITGSKSRGNLSPLIMNNLITQNIFNQSQQNGGNGDVRDLLSAKSPPVGNKRSWQQSSMGQMDAVQRLIQEAVSARNNKDDSGLMQQLESVISQIKQMEDRQLPKAQPISKHDMQKAGLQEVSSPLGRLQQMNPQALKKLLELKMQRQQFSTLSSAGVSATPVVGSAGVSIAQAEMGTPRPTKRQRIDHARHLPNHILDHRVEETSQIGGEKDLTSSAPNAPSVSHGPMAVHGSATGGAESLNQSCVKKADSRHEQRFMSASMISEGVIRQLDQRKSAGTVQKSIESALAETSKSRSAPKASEKMTFSSDKQQGNYEESILRNLRQAITETELVKVRDAMLEGISHFEGESDRVLIQAQLPKKNNQNSAAAAGDRFRGSKYRGPSKNRKKWQVMKMVNKETVRIGAIETEQDAARIYDFLAILTEGLVARTNFDYTMEQIQLIMHEFYFKDENSIGAKL